MTVLRRVISRRAFLAAMAAIPVVVPVPRLAPRPRRPGAWRDDWADSW